MEKVKVLIVGNHTCANRGDGAILRGLLDSLEKNFASTLDVTVMSRYPGASSYLLGRKIDQDPLVKNNYKEKFGRISSIIQFFSERWYPKILSNKIEGKLLFEKLPLPHHYEKFIEEVLKYDVIIQVGGSFFVDLYGDKQFEHVLLSVYKDKPILLLGHSLGPFERRSFRTIAQTVFPRVSEIVVREQLSVELYNGLFPEKEQRQRLVLSNDTAWLVNTDNVSKQKLASKYELDSKNKYIAITVRDLHPFDKRLGVTQTDYENHFIDLINKLINLGYHIIALSTCTGLDGYAKDDRMVALRLKEGVNDKTKMTVIMDELNDLEMGGVFANCDLTIGTRLHSTIISMRFGTPAIAIYYEHKSEGIMKSLDYGKRSIKIDKINCQSTIELVEEIVGNIEQERAELNKKIDCIYKETEKSLVDSLNATLRH
ncbi:colanic acid biosynthesis pyruvyl transferase WcaK [Vibrio vulnificus]|nr:colanic acid biosynthesis pyruvyl transferase WcaK [Vibrio vulnificus]